MNGVTLKYEIILMTIKDFKCSHAKFVNIPYVKLQKKLIKKNSVSMQNVRERPVI